MPAGLAVDPRNMGSIADCFPLDQETQALQLQTSQALGSGNDTALSTKSDVDDSVGMQTGMCDTSTSSAQDNVEGGGDPNSQELLHANEDLYGGVIIEHEEVPADPKVFRNRLQQSLKVGRHSRPVIMMAQLCPQPRLPYEG